MVKENPFPKKKFKPISSYFQIIESIGRRNPSDKKQNAHNKTKKKERLTSTYSESKEKT